MPTRDAQTPASLPLRDWARALGLLVLFLISVVASRFHARVPVDLGVYRAGGSAVLHGTTLYGASFSKHTGTSPLPFTYPPFSALVFVGLTLLPWVFAAILWFIASVGGLVYMVKVSFGQFLDRLDKRRSLLALAGIAGVMAWTPPVRDTLWFGQINLILAALVLTDCLRPRKRQGVLVGVATAMKLTPGLFIVYFIVARKGRAAVRALVTVAVCWGGAALLLPTASRQYWFHAAFDVNRPGRPGYWTNQTIDGFISRYHGAHWLWIPLGLIVALFGLWRAREAHRSGNELAAVVLVGLTSVLVSPISWLHTQVWFVAAIGVILGRGTERRRVMAAGGVLILLLARLSMLGDRLTRIYHVPVIGNVIENAYVFLLLFVIALLPVRDTLEGEITHPSSDLSIRGALAEAWRG